jgi:hypothetical protein
MAAVGSDAKLGSGKVSTQFVASDPDGVGDFAVTLVARMDAVHQVLPRYEQLQHPVLG